MQTKIVSMVYSMNDILSKEVFLVDELTRDHVGMGHLKVHERNSSIWSAVWVCFTTLHRLQAVCLIRPIPKNITALIEHMAAPKFLEYHIFFTNVCPGDSLRRLADADKLGVIKQVQEFYADYYAINSDLFSLNLDGSLSLSRPRATYTTAEESSLKRAHQGLLATLLSFKVKPHIRYQASSEAASKLALELTGTISGERELFTFNKSGAQTLLVRAPLHVILQVRGISVHSFLCSWFWTAVRIPSPPCCPNGRTKQ
jgi:vacuolar protein sorting-associated protein 45